MDTFPVAIAGPIVLGRRRFVGGGLFQALAHELVVAASVAEVIDES